MGEALSPAGGSARNQACRGRAGAPAATGLSRRKARLTTVLLVSADSEWRAIEQIFPLADMRQSPMGAWFETAIGGRGITVFHGGWGKISAAATTQYVIDHFRPDLLVNLGTCGGLEGRIERGVVVLVERTLVYDIIEQMTDPVAAQEHYATVLDLSWLTSALPTPVWRGQMLSADRDILAEDVRTLTEKYGAVVGDWESGAIAWVAKRNGVRCLILRGVSDLVSAGGGEAYDVRGLFAQRTAEIMEMLIAILPAWLAVAEPTLQIPPAA